MKPAAGDDPGTATGLGRDCPLPFGPDDRVLLGHGSGGRLSARLVAELFQPRLDDPELGRLGDAAVVAVEGVRLAVTTDAFVVQPAVFAGSDIGAISVNGTVNDLAMVGARPSLLTAAFVLEEGLPLDLLATIADSMASSARAAGVRLVAADTKVVERGSADGLFITTSGIGVVPEAVDLGPERIRGGDAVLVSGPVGSHGTAVMSRRAGIDFDVDVASDSAPLTGLVTAMQDAGEVHCLRDATRGGVATVLVELAEAARVGVTVEESAFPVLDGVRGACTALGLDPLYVANEGVCVAFVAGADAEGALAAARSHPLGRSAAIVGSVDSVDAAGLVSGAVTLRTPLGSTRPLLRLTGDQLPRIC